MMQSVKVIKPKGIMRGEYTGAVFSVQSRKSEGMQRNLHWAGMMVMVIKRKGMRATSREKS